MPIGFYSQNSRGEHVLHIPGVVFIRFNPKKTGEEREYYIELKKLKNNVKAEKKEDYIELDRDNLMRRAEKKEDYVELKKLKNNVKAEKLGYYIELDRDNLMRRAENIVGEEYRDIHEWGLREGIIERRRINPQDVADLVNLRKVNEGEIRLREAAYRIMTNLLGQIDRERRSIYDSGEIDEAHDPADWWKKGEKPYGEPG